MGPCGGFEIPVKSGLHISALTALLGLSITAAAQQPQQPAPVPDAPTPQQATPRLTDAAGGPIKPGGGAGTEGSATGSSGSQDGQGPVPQQAATPAPATRQGQQGPPPQNLSPAEIAGLIRVNVTYVEVPVTVKDSKGREVPGLTWRNFRVYENNTY